MTEPDLTPSPWRQRFLNACLLVQALVLGFVLLEMARGTPDAYPNEHARQAAISVTGLSLLLVFWFRRESLQLIAMAGTVAAIVWHISLQF